MAPSGTVRSVVYFHRSHIRHRYGHSRFVRNTVATSSTCPPAARSGSTRKAYGREGSTSSFAGRIATISRSKKTGYRSDILPHEYLPVLRFTLRKKHLERLAVDCAFLEPPLFEYRHLDARHGLYAAPNDLALERVKLLMVPIGKLDEWDALGHLD